MTTPFFSICIPQYNRTSFLIKALESLRQQTLRDFEVCVSDGGSTDQRIDELESWLENSALVYQLARSDVNLRYDSNTRKAMSLARGEYIVLMGNDDSFNGTDALAFLHDEIIAAKHPGVIISDFCDDATGDRAWRIREQRLYEQGPRTAANHFRNFSFVSGLTMHRSKCHHFTTDKWDGSEMYQTYIGCSIIASGGTLLERDHMLVRKDLVVPGESVDSYAKRQVIHPCPIQERVLPLGSLGRVVANAIEPYAGNQKHSLNLRILTQLIGFTYPFWLFEYRRVQSWNYAAGIAIGMRPAKVGFGIKLGVLRRAYLWLLYLIVTLLGLTLPIGLFKRMSTILYRIAKR